MLFPLQAFHLFSKAIKFKSNFICRTTPGAQNNARNYNDSVCRLINTIFGCHIDEKTAEEISLPISEGGLGISTSNEDFAHEQYTTSKTLSQGLAWSIFHQDEANDDLQYEAYMETRKGKTEMETFTWITHERPIWKRFEKMGGKIE